MPDETDIKLSRIAQEIALIVARNKLSNFDTLYIFVFMIAAALRSNPTNTEHNIHAELDRITQSILRIWLEMPAPEQLTEDQKKEASESLHKIIMQSPDQQTN